jgi:predicted dehydrogenase
MILVLGGGFGLYGHVAALAADGRQVATPARYRPLAETRPEMKGIVPHIRWVEDEHSALGIARSVCLARRPADNAALTLKLINSGSGGVLIIEKPIAPTPAEALALEHALDVAGRSWAVPYLFLHCDWFVQLAQTFREGGDVSIRWVHRQSASSGSWKTDEDKGGGAMAFYFIHCLAVIEAVCPGLHSRVVRMQRPDGASSITVGASKGGASISIEFTLADQALFEVRVGSELQWTAYGPFGAMPMSGQPDPRIPALQRFYRMLDTADGLKRAASLSRAVTQRWAASENSAG